MRASWTRPPRRRARLRTRSTRRRSSDYALLLGKIKGSNPGAVGLLRWRDQIKFVQQYGQFIGYDSPLFIGNIFRNAADAIGKIRAGCQDGHHAVEEDAGQSGSERIHPVVPQEVQQVSDFGQYEYDAMMLLDKVLTELKGNTEKEGLARP